MVMEEATKVSSEAPPVKVVGGEMIKEDKVVEKEEEDTTFDGGFVKVEKEGIDTKCAPIEEQKQVLIERSSSGSQRELHESQEKAKELELELEKVTGELKRYESENTLLKDELSSTKGKFEETEKKHEELEVVKKTLQEKISEGEERHSSQLKSLEDALQLHDVKHKELTEVKEAFDGLSLELQNSKSRLLEMERKISSKETLIEELTQELEKKKASESRFEQESINLKLKEELKDQEGKIRTANENLTIVLKEKDVLEVDMAEIRGNAAKTKEICDELEEKLKISDEKFSKTDAILSQALSQNSDLEQKLKSQEELSKQVSELKSALIVAEEEEKKLTSQMQEYQEKVNKLEFSLNQSSVRNSELEEYLRIALEKDAEHEDLGNVSTQRSVEIEDLFKTSQSKLEEAKEKWKDLYAATTKRSIELEHMELTIQKAVEDLSSRDTEVKSLIEESKDLEERIRFYEGKLAEESGQSLSLKEELDQSSSENELLADTNNRLKITIQELEGYLDAEKETANERFNQRDTEAKDLITKLKSHENLIEEHKRQVLEASGVADTRKVELEEALSKLKTLESTIKELEKENEALAEVNIKLNQELANHGSETSDFQAMLSASEAKKDQTAKELQESKIAIEHLAKQLNSEGERLRSQISSLAEENNQVNEIYQSTKNELVKLQADKSKSDAMVSEMEKLSAGAAGKSVLESNFEQVEKQLKEVEAHLKEEVAELTSKLQEHEHKGRDRDVLDEQAIQLHKELQASHTVLSEQETESTGKGDVEVKSRDIDLSFSTPKQRKSNRKLDASPSLSSSSGNVTIQKAETSHLMTFKIVLGVALVSVIIGIILGKKYFMV